MSPLVDFSYVPDIFTHDTLATGPNTPRAETLPRFGILERQYETDTPEDAFKSQWQRLAKYLQHLNAKAPYEEQYKVLFVARHGEGVHNVKEREVGREQWNEYWSRLEGDGNLTWVDPRLTNKGLEQAKAAGKFWIDANAVDMVPLPQKFFTSPLTRCLQTVEATWADVPMPESQPFQPVVVEATRELFGVHTCDRRSARSAIEFAFPTFKIEPSMTEEDELWSADFRETAEDHGKLWRDFLSQLFEDSDSTYVSVTTHSGATRALYTVLGHPDVWTAAGSVVPIVVCARGRSAMRSDALTEL
ncbi:unnamed protein product [Zymoseptoria tritici ST99CH_3D1]|nr:unnamed protein product [Zymoseptoria tritici ST99CH_3D1]